MADNVVGDSPEAIAYRLFEHVTGAEKKMFRTEIIGGYETAYRQWILNTYAECLGTVKDYVSRLT